MKIGQKIIQLREEQRLSQNQLSKILKIGQTTISKWERGIGYPSLEYIILLAKYFKVSADFLLGLEKF